MEARMTIKKRFLQALAFVLACAIVLLPIVAIITLRTLQIIRVNAAMKDCLAVKKSVFLYCTPRTPNV